MPAPTHVLYDSANDQIVVYTRASAGDGDVELARIDVKHLSDDDKQRLSWVRNPDNTQWPAEVDTSTVKPVTTFTRDSAAWLDGVVSFADQPRTDDTRGLLIETDAINQLRHTEAFDNAFWDKRRTTITADATTAPSGATTADKVEETAETNLHTVRVLIGATGDPDGLHCLSVYAKAAERSKFGMAVTPGDDVLNEGAVFDLTAGTATVTGTDYLAGIEDVGDGWFRCWMVHSEAVTPDRVVFQLVNDAGATNYAGTAGEGLYLWGAQREDHRFPTSYMPATTDDKTRSADRLVITGHGMTPKRGTVEMTVQIDRGTWNAVTAGESGSGSGESNMAWLFASESNFPVMFLYFRGSEFDVWRFRVARRSDFVNHINSFNGPPDNFAEITVQVRWSVADDSYEALIDGTVVAQHTLSNAEAWPERLGDLHIGSWWDGSRPLNGWVKALRLSSVKRTSFPSSLTADEHTVALWDFTDSRPLDPFYPQVV